MIARIEDFTVRIRNGLSKLSWHERRQVIRMLVASIEIDENGATVVFRVPPADAPIRALKLSAGAEIEGSDPQECYGLRTGRKRNLTTEGDTESLASEMEPES